jgi:hypothetical protein
VLHFVVANFSIFQKLKSIAVVEGASFKVVGTL